MNARDLNLYATTRNQLVRALQDAVQRNDAPARARVEAQLAQHPYADQDVRARAEQLLRPVTPVIDPPTVLDLVRGKAFRA